MLFSLYNSIMHNTYIKNAIKTRIGLIKCILINQNKYLYLQKPKRDICPVYYV